MSRVEKNRKINNQGGGGTIIRDSRVGTPLLLTKCPCANLAANISAFNLCNS